MNLYAYLPHISQSNTSLPANHTRSNRQVSHQMTLCLPLGTPAVQWHAGIPVHCLSLRWSAEQATCVHLGEVLTGEYSWEVRRHGAVTFYGEYAGIVTRS